VRQQIFAQAIATMSKGSPFDPALLAKLIFDRKFYYGFESAFEHAVHLITTERMELRTAPELQFHFQELCG